MAILIAKLLSAAIIVFTAVLDVMRVFGIRSRMKRLVAKADYYDPFSAS